MLLIIRHVVFLHSGQKRDIARCIGHSRSHACGEYLLDYDHIDDDREFRRKLFVMNDIPLKCNGSVMSVDWLDNGIEGSSDGVQVTDQNC